MAEVKLARRNFLKGAGAAGAAGAAVVTGLTACSPETATAAAPVAPEVWHTLNATEAAFITAAVDTLIPADDLTPSGSEFGLAVFIDRQLAGAFGNGARLYRQGPFLPGKPEHGYQLALTPREFFRAGIESTNQWTQKTYGKDFDRLNEAERTEAMKALEEGKPEFAGFKSSMFFDAAAPAHHGRVLRRSDLWRQSRQGGVEDDRLPRSAGQLPRRDQDLFQQEIRQGDRSPSRTFRKEGERWSPMLKEVDAVIVGMGWTGSILARELTKAGLERRRPRARRACAARARISRSRASATSSNIRSARSCSRTRRWKRSACAMRAARPRCRCGGWARSCRARMSAAPARIGTARPGAVSKPTTC